MKVLAVGAHPDDIEIFMYGLLSIYKKEGHQVYTMIATDGAKGGAVSGVKLAIKRANEAIKGLEKLSLPIFLTIPLAVGLGVGFMILLNVTHPPAGGNPIIVIIGSASFDYLLSPVITGCIIIIVSSIVINRFILKKSYPK